MWRSIVFGALMLLAGTAGAAPDPNAALNASRQGVVLVEQAGKVVGLGIVLAGDGRVLTSRSRLGAPSALFVRYSNGPLEPVRIGHVDEQRDLALLVPKTPRTKQGIHAANSQFPPMGGLSSFTLGQNRALTPVRQTVSITETMNYPLLALSAAPKPNEVGGPLLDEQGNAVGVVVSLCAGTQVPCTRTPYALPVAVVKNFLRAAPPEASMPLPWLGVSGVAVDTRSVRGIRLTAVEPNSPAAALGLHVSVEPAPSDILVALGGEPVPSPHALERVLAKHTPGDRVELLLFSDRRFHTATVRLGDHMTPAGGTAAKPAAPGAPAPAAPAPAAPNAVAKPAAPSAVAKPAAPSALAKPAAPSAPAKPPAPASPKP